MTSPDAFRVACWPAGLALSDQRQAAVSARAQPRHVNEPVASLGVAGVSSQAVHEVTRRFAGRRAELREIAARATAAAAGQLQTVIIEGRPGIGKTALLARALDQLKGFRQLRADCAVSGAIDQLAGQAGFARHPAADQRGRPELLVIIRALVQLGPPLLIALDNVHRLDAESAAELASTLSALGEAALLVIVTAPDPWPAERAPAAIELHRHLLDGGLASRLTLRELSVAETGQLLDRVGTPVSEQAAQRLHSYTGGHPALVGVLLDQGLTAAHTAPADYLGLFDPLVIGIAAVAWSLPKASRDLLAAMAVSQESWPLAIVGSVAQAGDPFEALEPLLDTGLVEWFPDQSIVPVRIRYPLFRDVIYRSLPAAVREQLHARAANFSLGTQAWAHKVAAAQHPEPTLAAMLEQEANRYYLAGDSERAGTLLMWSMAVMGDQADRERFALQAARWWLTLRATDWGPRVETCLTRLPASAQRSLLLGVLADGSGRYAQARSLLTEARQLAHRDVASLSLRADIDLASATVHASLGDVEAVHKLAEELLARPELPAGYRGWAEHYAADATGRIAGAEAALARLRALVPDPEIDNAVTDDSMAHDAVTDDAMAENAVIYGAGDGVAAAEARSADQGTAMPGSQSVRLWTRGSWRVLSGRLRDGDEDLATMLRTVDRAAVDAVVPMARAFMAYARYLLGDWRAAEQSVTLAVAALTGNAVARLRIPVHAIAACVDAAAGRSESAARHLLAAERWHTESGPADYLVFPVLAAATSAQARGDYGRMLAALQPLLTTTRLGRAHLAWWQPLHVEALIGTGQLAAAQHALARLTDLPGVAGRQPATVAWLEAWLSAASHDDFRARARFEDTTARPAGRDDVPLHRARLEHEYGRYLNSRRNRRAAIARLRLAYDLYRGLGARPYAERCAEDLVSCGAQTPVQAGDKPADQAVLALSARERRIAYLAVRGLTNQQIASELFISAKTVEYHLGHVFAKLGISSRRQLPARMGESPED